MIIGYLLIGLLAGMISGFLVRGRGFGIIGDLVVGVIGAIIGGYIFTILNITGGGFFVRLLMAVIGAVILLSVIKIIKKA